MLKLNWNDTVKVKLTEHGKEIYRAQYDELNEIMWSKGKAGFERPEPRVDENGLTAFQLWHFIQLYGNYIGVGLEEVVDSPYFYINEKDLEVST